MTHQNIETYAGVWIDHRQAIVVTLISGVESTVVVESDAERQHGRAQGTSANAKPEDSRERKFHSQLDAFYDRVIAALGGAESVALYGPGEAKGEMKKRIEKTVRTTCRVTVETADRMTTPEFEAKARGGFHPMVRGAGDT